MAESTSETESTSEATADSHGGSDNRAKVSQASSTGQFHQVKKQQIRNTNQSRPAQRSQPNLIHKMLAKLKLLTKQKIRSPDYSEIAAIFEAVSKQPNFAENVKHSFKAFLRMEDTGGQPELMDMLPALTIGPGLYLLFFRAKTSDPLE